MVRVRVVRVRVGATVVLSVGVLGWVDGLVVGLDELV